jgi:hypothetical protein
LTVEEKIQAQGYIHYMFSTKRVPPPSSEKEVPGSS